MCILYLYTYQIVLFCCSYNFFYETQFRYNLQFINNELSLIIDNNNILSLSVIVLMGAHEWRSEGREVGQAFSLETVHVL